MRNILLSLIIFVFWGCINDNGNYDYNPTRELRVLGLDGVFLTQGESVTLTPKVIVRGDKTETAVENVEFEWRIDNKVVSTEPTYTYVAESDGEFFGMLRFIDPLTKVVGTSSFGIKVGSKYKTGLVILSEENGKGMLSFIRSKQISAQDTVIFEGEWKDIYAESNGGEELKGIPYSVIEHWTYDDNNPICGELSILSNDGGRTCIQELNGESMKRETYIEQEFDEGRLPLNFAPKEIMQTCWDSFILDESGEVYIRRSTNNSAFHTGYFSDKVKLWNGQKFSKLMFPRYDKTDAVLALKIDEQTGENNYVGISSDYNTEHKNLKELELVASRSGVNINDFKNVQDEIICSDWRNTADYYETGMSVLMKTTTGDYILHCFVLDETTGTLLKVVSSTKINLTQEKGLSKVVGMCTNKKKNYTYYCDDYTIYALDNMHDNKFYEVKKFDKKIVAITDQSLLRNSSYPTALVVAFEDGMIEIWEFERQMPYKFHTKLYTSQYTYGNIKDIVVKAGVSTVFFY